MVKIKGSFFVLIKHPLAVDMLVLIVVTWLSWFLCQFRHSFHSFLIQFKSIQSSKIAINTAKLGICDHQNKVHANTK